MTPPTLLVYRTGQLGDTLVSLPAVRAIRAGYPGHDLVLLTDQHPGRPLVSSWDVFRGTGLFSRAIFYTPAATPWGWLRQLTTVVRQVRALKPEAVFYLRDPHWTHARRDHWFFRVLCGIRRVHGTDETGHPFGTRDAAGRLWRLPSETDRLLRIVAETGVRVPPRHAMSTALPVSAGERARVDRLWAVAGVPDGALVIALGPGSKMAAKQWPAERFERLASLLLARHPDAWLLVVGGPEDERFTRRFAAAGPRVINAAGELSIFESAEALGRCRLYVGNDTGAMHLAAAMSTHCVAIFSARDHPGRWDPYGTGHTVLRTDPPCAGCLLEMCVEHRTVCLTDIAVDEVFATVEKALTVERPLPQRLASTVSIGGSLAR